MYGRLVATAAVGVLALGLATNANALVVDTFNTTDAYSDPAGVNPNSGTITDLLNIVGGTRYTLLNRVLGTSTVNVTYNDAGNGLFTLSNADSNSTTFIDYDGVGTDGAGNGAGLGSADFTVGGAQNAFDMRIILNDFATSVTVTVYDSNSSDFVTHSSGGGIPANSNVPLLFLYSDYTGVDFTDIERITIDIVAPFQATDLQIDFFSTTTTESPEPATLALFGLSMAGLGLVQRRRRRNG